MHSGQVFKLYQIGQRGKPIVTVGRGDLAQPYARSLWQRVTDFGRTLVEIARESRELETRLTNDERFRRFGQS